MTSPTITPPISPGPAVAATASTSRQRHARIGERGGDQRLERLDMRARRDLGHDAAIGRVRRFLPGEPVRQDRRSPVTSAAAVSSHEDSRPRISMALFRYARLVAGLSKEGGRLAAGLIALP